MINIYSTSVTSEVTSELLILQDLKEHLNITHNDDDAYLDRLIVSTRKRIEKITGRAIGTQQRQIVMELEGDTILPGSPVKSIVSAQVFDNTSFATATADSYKLIGNYFKTYSSNTWTVSYNCGYASEVELPADIMLAWLNECAYRYMNRGDVKSAGDYDTETYRLLKPYIDLSWV